MDLLRFVIDVTRSAKKVISGGVNNGEWILREESRTKERCDC
jgi:hypothetical protein